MPSFQHRLPRHHAVQRHRRKHPFLEMDRRVSHATGDARGADTSQLAAEGDQLAVAALTTLEVEAAMLEEATPEILLERGDHELGQAAKLFRVLPKCWPVPTDECVQRGVFRPTANVVRRLDGSKASCGVAHGRVPWRGPCQRGCRACSSIEERRAGGDVATSYGMPWWPLVHVSCGKRDWRRVRQFRQC